MEGEVLLPDAVNLGGHGADESLSVGLLQALLHKAVFHPDAEVLVCGPWTQDEGVQDEPVPEGSVHLLQSGKYIFLITRNQQGRK